jgi:hypothetical protein
VQPGATSNRFDESMLEPAASRPSTSHSKKDEAPTPVRGAIFVRVLDTAFRAMDPSKLTVEVENDAGMRSPIRDDGVGFAALDLSEGRYSVSARCEGYRTCTATVDVTSAKCGHQLEFRMRGAHSLKIKLLTDDGHDLAERLLEEDEPTAAESRRGVRGDSLAQAAPVIAVATREQPGQRLPQTALKNHSRFAAGIYRGWGSRYTWDARGESDDPIPKGYAGILELFEPLPLYVSATVRDVVLKSQLVSAGAEEIVFNISVDRVKACVTAVRLRVVDALTEQPLKDCEVGLNDRSASGGGWPVGDSGDIWIRNVPVGCAELGIIARDHEMLSDVVHIEPSETTDLGTYRLQRAVSIQGTVILPVDKSAGSLWMSLVPLDSFDPNRRVGANWFHPSSVIWNNKYLSHFETDSSGEFAFMNLARGRYLVRLEHPDRWALRPVVVDTTQGSVEGLRLQAEDGARVDIQLDRDADEDTWLRIFDKDGQAVCDIEPSPFTGWANEKGSIYLPAGAYKCAVFERGARLTTLSLDVSAATTSTTLRVPH